MQSRFEVTAPYFLVKVPMLEEKTNRQMEGSLFLPPDTVFFTKNTQSGEIVGIGEGAAKKLQGVKVGDTLLFHHFIQGTMEKGNNRSSFIFSEDGFNYYAVTAYSFKGKGCQAFGYFDGKSIVPNVDYVFLEGNQIPKESDELKSDVLTIPEIKKMSDRDIQKRLRHIKAKIKNFTRSRLTDDAKREISQMDAEREKLTMFKHKKEYVAYKVAHTHPSQKINSKVVFALNLATNYTLSFKEKDYRVVEKKYIGMV
jgi:co-chaperonin GroES (HSP10)/Skp family chaperone for outer membrane proteins